VKGEVKGRSSEELGEDIKGRMLEEKKGGGISD